MAWFRRRLQLYQLGLHGENGRPRTRLKPATIRLWEWCAATWATDCREAKRLDVVPAVDGQSERQFVVTTIICLIIMMQMISWRTDSNVKLNFDIPGDKIRDRKSLRKLIRGETDNLEGQCGGKNGCAVVWHHLVCIALGNVIQQTKFIWMLRPIYSSICPAESETNFNIFKGLFQHFFYRLSEKCSRYFRNNSKS